MAGYLPPYDVVLFLARLQFLLEVEELAGLTAQLEPWRRDVFTPLVIEVGGQQQQQPQHTLI